MNEDLETLAKIHGDMRNLICEFWKLEGFYINKGIEEVQNHSKNIKILGEIADKIFYDFREESKETSHGWKK